MNALLPFCVAVLFTLSVSAFCSLLEAMILSTTTAEIEALKRVNERKGRLLERFRVEMDETSTAILSLNTLANTFGSTVCGSLGVVLLRDVIPMGEDRIGYLIGLLLALLVLVLSEILPKNIGVLYRPSLQPLLVDPLHAVRGIMGALGFNLVSKRLIRMVAPKEEEGDDEGDDEQEIKLLAEKSAEDGTLSVAESTIITNTLSLDDTRVFEIMTPRTVVHALEDAESIQCVFKRQANIPFARMPVFRESIDTIVGMVRRRDLLKAKAEDRDTLTVSELMQEVIFIPDTASLAHALQQLIRAHQQLAVAVDEFGSVSGVITMEDVMEHILGQEIFERDDPAVDMRELARRRERVRARKRTRENASLGAVAEAAPEASADDRLPT